jgi:hypothetical protein
LLVHLLSALCCLLLVVVVLLLLVLTMLLLLMLRLQSLRHPRLQSVAVLLQMHLFLRMALPVLAAA